MEKKKILTAYAEKRITIRKAAEALGVDYWQMQEFLEETNVPVTDLTKTEIAERKHKIKSFR